MTVIQGLLILLALVALPVVAMLVYVRLAYNDPDRWHIDPMEPHHIETRNFFLLVPGEGKRSSPQFDMPVNELVHAFDRVALAAENTRLLAGSPDAQFATYVVRSKWFGLPDFVSVRCLPLGDHRSTLAVLSRSRFGTGDLNVNRIRVLSWIKTLQAQ